VELRVQDTGIGIAATEQARIFERFHRVEGAQGRGFEGTGIGLSLVYDLARLHGGSTRVESQPGVGSVFIVSIPTGTAHISADCLVGPLTDETPVQRGHQVLEARQWATQNQGAPPASVVVSASRSPARILVVDDNKDIRQYIVEILSNHWTVETAADGAEALAAARKAPPDLVLSDMMMPVMNGVTLLHELRADPRTDLVPVILLSARAGEEARIEGLETGADDYLIKPFAPRELLARVRTHLTMAQVRKNAAETARELAATRAQLIAKLEKTNRELVESYEQLAATQAQLVHSAKMASLGELVAGIAHEVNNPLSFVKSHLGTVRRALDTLDLPSVSDASWQEHASTDHTWTKIRSRLAEVERGIERIQALVIKLRTFSRLDEGERKRVSFRECVDSILTILHHRMGPQLSVELQLDAPDEIDCYPALLNQALMNLVANAIEAVGTAGTIHITTSVASGTFRLCVSDTGPGVPKALRERILEPFFTTKPVGQGTGLGLSIAYAIAQKHGGRLELLDDGRPGATFAFSFPL
jgi:signal transduction histidine kinase